MEGFWSNLRKAILSGIMISVGGIVYLSIDYSFFGSLMFSFGLLTILYKGFNLYTGKVGYVEKISQVPPLLVTLIGNIIGVAAIAALYRGVGANMTRLSAMCEKKMAYEWWQTLLLAIMCGVMMYLAVSLFRDNKSPLLVMMAISIFIMAGFEHSIASLFYYATYFGIDTFMPDRLLSLGIMVIGNAIGSLGFRAIEVKAKPSGK